MAATASTSPLLAGTGMLLYKPAMVGLVAKSAFLSRFHPSHPAASRAMEVFRGRGADFPRPVSASAARRTASPPWRSTASPRTRSPLRPLGPGRRGVAWSPAGGCAAPGAVEVRVVDVPGAANALRFVMVPGTLPAASLVRLRAAAPLLANASLVARTQFPVLDWRYQHLGDVAGTALLQALDNFRGGVAALRVIARLPLDSQRSVLAELHLQLGALYRRRVTVLPLQQHKEEGRVEEPGPGGVAMVEQNAAEVDEAPVENGQLAEEVQDQHGAAAEHAQELLDEDAHAAQQEAELRQAKIDIAECLLLEAYDHMMAKKGDVRRLVAEMNEARANRNWDDPIV